MTTQIENDTDQEVLNISDQDGANATKEDRGDDFTPTPDPDAAPATGANEDGSGADGAAATAAEGGDEGQDGDGGRAAPGIPKHRFNEVNEARKTAEARAAQLEQELKLLKAEKTPAAAPSPAPANAPAEQQFDVEAKEQDYVTALMDGDEKKAAQIRREINANLVQEATRQVAAQLSQRDVERQVGMVIRDGIKEHPWLDTTEGAEAVELIAAMRDRLVGQGMALHEALKAAIDKIAPKFAPAVEPPSRDLPEADKPRDTRSANAVSRGAADSVTQPPALQAGIGNRATAARVDVGALTDDQFAALPDAEKKRLRGD